MYAESSANDFLPCAGPLLHVVPPTASAHVRVESAVAASDAVSMFYAPLIGMGMVVVMVVMVER